MSFLLALGLMLIGALLASSLLIGLAWLVVRALAGPDPYPDSGIGGGAGIFERTGPTRDYSGGIDTGPHWWPVP